MLIKMLQANFICFDADFTLIKYKLKNFLKLEYQSLSRCLVKLGYPDLFNQEEFLSKMHTHILNGLVADLQNGFLLKLSKDHRVLKAYYGFEELSPQKLEEHYGSSLLFQLEGITNYYIPGKRWVFLTHFAYGAAMLFRAGVELYKRGELSSLENLVTDIKKAVNMNFDTVNGESLDSEFYPAFYADPKPYVHKHHEDIARSLEALKARGKKLVLVTNSSQEYSEVIFKHAYGENWKSYFEYLVYSARKPFFFSNEAPFEQLGSKEFKAGNSKELERLLGEGSYVYVGDHYIGDVLAPKLYANWKVVAFLEEIYYEKGLEKISTCEEIEVLDENTPEDEVLEYYEEWGSFFLEGLTETLWWSLIKQYSDLCAPNLESLLSVLE